MGAQMHKSFLSLTGLAMLVTASTGAFAQNTLSINPEQYELFAKEGFKTEEVVAFAKDLEGKTSEVLTGADGSTFAEFQSLEEVNFVYTAEFCEPAPCHGLHFWTSFGPVSDLNLSLNDLNTFMEYRPQGNIHIGTEDGELYVQRLITNFSGITKGQLAAEFYFFSHFADGFRDFINSQNSVSSLQAPTSDGQSAVVAASTNATFTPSIRKKLLQPSAKPGEVLKGRTLGITKEN